MKRVYLLGGCRSHIGVKNGMFRFVLPEDLGAAVLKETVRRYQLRQIDEIIGGNAVGTGGNIIRLSALKAGLSEEIPAFSIDMQCASGLQAVAVADAKIRGGLCDCVIAGGFESSSLQPLRYYHKGDPRRITEKAYSCAQFSPGECCDTAMLDGAERTAQKEKVSRQELDAWALESHKRASRSKEFLEPWIVPCFGSKKDEGIRERINSKLLSRMPAVSGKLTTAGNCCLLHDGAAFVVLVSEEMVRRFSLSPVAELVHTGAVGIDPQYSPLAAQTACDKILQECGLSYQEISQFEFNEAFAVIDVLFERQHPELVSRYNPLGGALAYGHPYGASGGIILIHLLAGLRSGYGICSIAAAGGLGQAVLIKKV